MAGLLSYEVERRIAEGTRLERNDPADRRRVASRLDYRLEGDRPGAMSTLALFWPHPRLAELGDPLAAARRRPDAMLGLTEVERDVRLAVATEAESELRLARHAGEAFAGDAVFRWLGAGPPSGLGAASVVDLLSGGRAADDSDEGDTTSRLRLHVDNALAIVAGHGDAVQLLRCLLEGFLGVVEPLHEGIECYACRVHGIHHGPGSDDSDDAAGGGPGNGVITRGSRDVGGRHFLTAEC